ncbi:MAG: DUF4826 family protein [Gammaproteobacteria bacterium]
MSSPTPFDQQAFDQWHKTQQQELQKYLQSRAVFDGHISGEWLWIIPHRAMLGRIWLQHDKSRKLWVIAGVVPTDHVPSRAANTPREAARYFALKWQMEAARLGKSAAPQTDDGKVDWKSISDNIASRAEWLYGLVGDNRRWNADGMPLFRIDHEAAQA